MLIARERGLTCCTAPGEDSRKKGGGGAAAQTHNPNTDHETAIFHGGNCTPLHASQPFASIRAGYHSTG